MNTKDNKLGAPCALRDGKPQFRESVILTANLLGFSDLGEVFSYADDPESTFNN